MYGGMDGWIDSPTCHYKTINKHYVTNFCNLLLRKVWWKLEEGMIDAWIGGCSFKSPCLFSFAGNLEKSWHAGVDHAGSQIIFIHSKKNGQFTTINHSQKNPFSYFEWMNKNSKTLFLSHSFPIAYLT